MMYHTRRDLYLDVVRSWEIDTTTKNKKSIVKNQTNENI